MADQDDILSGVSLEPLHNSVNPVSFDHGDGLGYEPEAQEPSEADDRAEEVQNLITRSVQRAVDHYRDTLEPDQIKATDYYMGRPFGDEEEGRSQFVATTVRDATLAQLPSLMRIFFGSDPPAEFRPRGPEDEDLASQVTDYIGYVITEDNPGFLIGYAVMKDALVRRMGLVKWWWEEFYRVEGAEYTGLDEAALGILAGDPNVTIESVEQRQIIIETPNGPAPSVVFDVRANHRKLYGCPKIAAIPPEELVWTPNAVSLDTAPLVAHVREVPRDYLVRKGIPEELLDEVAGERRDIDHDSLRDARQVHGEVEVPFGLDEDVDDSQVPVVFAEVWALVDGDGDGVAELRLFECVGQDFIITNGDGFGEVVDELPLAWFCPDPEPHTVVGLSNYDLVGDLQHLSSQVIRATLNSLAAAVEPVMEVVEGEVNMADVLNPDINKVVRVRRPGMLREVKSTFVGGDTLPMLEYIDGIKENRTGQHKGAIGLDADALQSTTKAGVAGILNASQQRIELIARIFAETGWKRLMKGLLKLVAKHQDQPRTVRLRNRWVTVDPRHWDATMDVTVNVGLGAGPSEEQLAVLFDILARQEQYLANGVPLVSFAEIRYTLSRILAKTGEKSIDRFFKPWGPEEQQQFEAMQAQNQQPDPATMMLQIEAAKTDLQRTIDEAKLELERWKIQLQDDRERDKAARELALKERELEMKHQIEILDAELRAQVAANRQEQIPVETPSA